jgi:hypothetical protein
MSAKALSTECFLAAWTHGFKSEALYRGIVLGFWVMTDFTTITFQCNMKFVLIL